MKLPLRAVKSPVQVDGEFDCAIIDADNQIIAECFGKSSKTHIHNAEENANKFVELVNKEWKNNG